MSLFGFSCFKVSDIEKMFYRQHALQANRQRSNTIPFFPLQTLDNFSHQTELPNGGRIPPPPKFGHHPDNKT